VSTDSTQALLVMHALRIKGVAGTEAVCRISGLGPESVSAHAEELTEAGLAVSRTGRFTGWALTAAGRRRYEELWSQHRRQVEGHEELTGAYDHFVPLNDRFKTVCTAWQVRDLDAQVLNDHEDPDYDAEIIRRLGDIHQALSPIVGRLAGVDSRFGGYHPRFDDSYRRVQAGERDAFTRPMSESYHDVWMELHEDLLLTLNISREVAGA
jgi:hypothetical protein